MGEEGEGLGYKRCSRRTQIARRDGQRAGREQTRARRGSAPRAHPGRSLRLGMRWGPCPALRGSPGDPKGAGLWFQPWTNTVLQHRSRLVQESSSSQHPTPGQLAAHVAPGDSPNLQFPAQGRGIHPSIHLPTHPSTHPPIHPSPHPSIPPSTHPDKRPHQGAAEGPWWSGTSLVPPPPT